MGCEAAVGEVALVQPVNATSDAEGEPLEVSGRAVSQILGAEGPPPAVREALGDEGPVQGQVQLQPLE